MGRMAAPRPAGPARIMVCGGIGSGKSAAGRLLAQRGFTVIDADRVGHGLLEPGHPVAERVAARWPQATAEGRVDRSLLGGIVFADREQLRELEAMTHPEIGRLIRERAARAGESPAAAELPVLGELADGLRAEGWRRVVVDAPDQMRRARLTQRGMTEGDIERRMAAQPPRGQWRAAADYLLPNRASLRALEREVDGLLSWLRSTVRI